LALEKERKTRQDGVKIKQGKAGSSIYIKLHCRYRLACVFSLIDLAYMGLHVFLFYHGMGFSSCDNIFNLALPFPDSFDEMGSLIQFMWDGRIGFEVVGWMLELKNKWFEWSLT